MTEREVLEFAMRLESISGLAEASLPRLAPGMVQFQYQLTALSEQIQEMATGK